MAKWALAVGEAFGLRQSSGAFPIAPDDRRSPKASPGCGDDRQTLARRWEGNPSAAQGNFRRKNWTGLAGSMALVTLKLPSLPKRLVWSGSQAETAVVTSVEPMT